MVKLTNFEKETIICFNEAEPQARVFTYNGRMIRDLAKLAEERPVDVKFISENDSGGYTYDVPKKWVKIRASRILSEEEHAKRSAMGKERMARLRESKLSSKS